ncbi:hypothetical protein [Plantactinospora soyae]|uniref:Uncharacterized protein n=1 Tax=Plantactinospora soyae TaxID=1544732 RepID=A0A927MCZ6_9ACTN|nr:hypothetical protein [Plantactinospora soyae]MBE1490856.1 hypothetical protein [Plantactinospora soyae]
MLDGPGSRDHYPQRVARVRDLVAVGDDAMLAVELVDLAARNEDVWRFDGAHVRTVVEVLPPARRHALILDVLDRAAAAAQPVPVDALLGWLARGLEPGVLSWRAGRYLIDAAAAAEVRAPNDLRVLAEVAVRETGIVPPRLLAVMRRTEKAYRLGAEALRPWLEKALDPLNVGEPWAEAANAEAPDPRLLPHALTATGGRPAAGWSRHAAALAAGLGTSECRVLIHHWFTLVSQPRTIRLRRHALYDANEVLDPHNALALRGLVYLLAVIPPHPSDPSAVGRLARDAAEKVPGHGPRSQLVMYAAAHTLERLGSVPALRELEQLRARKLPDGFARRVDAAIARRRAALGHPQPTR